MADIPENARATLKFRITPEVDGRVYLSLEGVDGKRVSVRRPVTQVTLRVARDALTSEILADFAERGSKHTTPHKNESNQTETQIAAQREIDIALTSKQFSNFLDNAQNWIKATLIVIPLQILIGLCLIAAAYKGIQISSENFWTPLHLVVLALYLGILAFGIFAIATEKNRQVWGSKIRTWFGFRGLLIFLCFLLVTFAAVVSSFTFFLYELYPTLLTLPPGTSDGIKISEARLLDFYMWHFWKMVPLVSVTDTLKWNEPINYTSGLVGFLILLFQGFVVIPIITTIGYYWKNRSMLEKDPYEYVYDDVPSNVSVIASQEN